MKNFIPNTVCQKNNHDWELGQDVRCNGYFFKQWTCRRCHSVKTDDNKEKLPKKTKERNNERN